MSGCYLQFNVGVRCLLRQRKEQRRSSAIVLVFSAGTSSGRHSAPLFAQVNIHIERWRCPRLVMRVDSSSSSSSSSRNEYYLGGIFALLR